MLASMTGYGKGTASHQDIDYTVEVRSVNHRFCDVSIQSPRWIKPLDNTINRSVLEKFERGRFDISISVSYPEESSHKELRVDRALASDGSPHLI